jgi:hypothetical protein
VLLLAVAQQTDKGLMITMSASATHAHSMLPQQLPRTCGGGEAENAKNQGDLAYSRGAFEEAYKCYNHALNLCPTVGWLMGDYRHLARETIAGLMCSRAEACLKISESQQRRSDQWYNTVRLTHTNCMEALSMESKEVPFSGQLKFRIIRQKNFAERLLAEAYKPGGRTKTEVGGTISHHETQPCGSKRRSSSQDIPEDVAPRYTSPSFGLWDASRPSFIQAIPGINTSILSSGHPFIQATPGINMSAVAEPETKKKQRKGDARSSAPSRQTAPAQTSTDQEMS